MGRFATTVPYYQRFRPPYPPEFFQEVAGLLRLDGTQALVDLGCGPGLLALGFAPRLKSVAGVDPEPAMIAAARKAAARAGVRLTLYESRVEDLPGGVGPFAVATIGRALHWMEPRATGEALDRFLLPDGLVAICEASSAEGQNPWLPAFDSLRENLRAAKDEGRSRADTAAFFAGSRFVVREKFALRKRQTISVDILAGRLLSMSNTSPAVLGARSDAVAGEVRAALAPFARTDGTLEELIEARATILARAL